MKPEVIEPGSRADGLIVDGEIIMPRQRPGVSSWNIRLLRQAARWSLPIAHNRLLRRFVMGRARDRIADGSRSQTRSAGVVRDRRDFGRAVIDTVDRALDAQRLSDATIRRLSGVLLLEQFVQGGHWETRQSFQAAHGCNPPSFMVISPTGQCNLHCDGCYAGADTHSRNSLPWDVLNRICTELHDLWGARFVVISGGEPLMYRDQGNSLVDLAEANPGLFFMFYTNGTLIDRKLAKRLASLGNLMPSISLEGFKETTDRRRGKGTWNRIMSAMDYLREAKVLFGVSMTATRLNYQELLSDELLDLLFDEKGAMFGWIFQLMPVGRAVSLDLVLSPEQRVWLWQHTWEQIRKRSIFLADFWNSATICDGCVSAGRPGGYFYIDWNGHMCPCVFNPYSPVNIKDVYAEGGTLNDAWAHPFFEAIRTWQYRYGFRDGGARAPQNQLMPCPIRDHHADMMRLIREFEPEPIDEAAAAALVDPDYHRALEAFDSALESLTEPIWQRLYMD